ncbi:PepSY-associated TM helix domain-containing protein [Methylorubrum extorquens]|uniref:PepSY-associated TM helix domain-containing protein n=1 Tax=Methylorubrum extorquens TaxID=408 RepID=UPI002238C6C6|nr:PepSY-associated TM helix domain-containing protein [Methylorubrum extorquens]UYW28556.1 PepSY domain-containing protein [Methylorubrum extorquens]UYW31730.1 PepSY domain-containing protein [Methylorubrum extorquens]
MPSAFSPARTVVFRLHWALGLTAGLVLALMGLTGALMSYEEAITAFANRDRIQVSAAQDRPPLTPSALAARIEAQLPGQRVSALTLSGDPAQSAVARFARDRAGGRPSPVYADPTEGTVLGPVRLEAFFATVRELHRWLLLPGEGKGWGRTITGACAIALLVFLGSGLYLRWPGRHRWRVWLRPNLARPGRARWWSLHAVAGTWLLPVYAVSALSGLWWSYDWYRAGATWLLTGQALPARAVERAPGGKPPDSKIPEGKIPEGTSAIDTAWAEFSATHTASLATLSLPGPEAAAIRIRWYAPDSNLRNEATYDARTGAGLTDKRAADAALGPRLADNMLEVHRGRFFGAPVALLFCLVALVLPGFFATGLTLYVLRRRAGRRRAPARASLPAEASVQG